MQRSSQDVIAGITFVAFGVAFAIGATAYPIGTLARMGPGLFPLIVGVLLAVLGAIVAIRPALQADGGEPLTRPAWRGLVLVVGGLVVFGLTVRGLGLLPSTFLAALLAALASRRTRPPAAVAMALGLTVVSYLIFVVGLRLNLPLLGTWIPRF